MQNLELILNINSLRFCKPSPWDRYSFIILYDIFYGDDRLNGTNREVTQTNIFCMKREANFLQNHLNLAEIN